MDRRWTRPSESLIQNQSQSNSITTESVRRRYASTVDCWEWLQPMSEVRRVIGRVKHTPMSPLSEGTTHWKCVHYRQSQNMWAVKPSPPAVKASHLDRQQYIFFFPAWRLLQCGEETGKWIAKYGSEQSKKQTHRFLVEASLDELLQY